VLVGAGIVPLLQEAVVDLNISPWFTAERDKFLFSIGTVEQSDPMSDR
jgi:hypothetical protein